MVAAVAIGSAVVGAAGSAFAASKAADAQKSAARTAANTELQMFERTAEMQAPWREAGEGALKDLTAGTTAGGDYMRDFTAADFQRDPGYQFRMDEGMRGVEASAAARGGALSGGALKDISRFGQDFASGEFSNAYNRFNADRDRRFGRLAELAGIGQTATGQIANQGANVAANIGNYQTQAGNARASGYVGAANSVNQGLGTIGNWVQQQGGLGGYSGPGSAGWSAGGFSGTNDRPWASTGNNMDWFMRNGLSGD